MLSHNRNGNESGHKGKTGMSCTQRLVLCMCVCVFSVVPVCPYICAVCPLSCSCSCLFNLLGLNLTTCQGHPISSSVRTCILNHATYYSSIIPKAVAQVFQRPGEAGHSVEYIPITASACILCISSTRVVIAGQSRHRTA